MQNADRIHIETAAQFVVVSWWSDSADNPFGLKGVHSYETAKTLNDALDIYDEYERGEWPRARAMGIFAADANGLPIGRLDPALLLKLMREKRAA